MLPSATALAIGAFSTFRQPVKKDRHHSIVDLVYAFAQMREHFSTTTTTDNNDND
jgi:hypothetical protein